MKVLALASASARCDSRLGPRLLHVKNRGEIALLLLGIGCRRRRQDFRQFEPVGCDEGRLRCGDQTASASTMNRTELEIALRMSMLLVSWYRRTPRWTFTAIRSRFNLKTLKSWTYGHRGPVQIFSPATTILTGRIHEPRCCSASSRGCKSLAIGSRTRERGATRAGVSPHRSPSSATRQGTVHASESALSERAIKSKPQLVLHRRGTKIAHVTQNFLMTFRPSSPSVSYAAPILLYSVIAFIL